jgi:hypothetical protein
MAAAVVEMSARDACVMAPTGGATHHMSAAEMAASGVATSEVTAAATPYVAATSEVTAAATPYVAAASEVAATSGMPVSKRGDRRAGCGNAEQQRCDDPNKSRVRRTHSSSPRRAAAILATPALELDAPRAPVFKLTHIKTR